MIKLITFNIKCGGTDIYSIDHRAPLLKVVLDQYDADLIGFQEATPNWMEHLEKDLARTREEIQRLRGQQAENGAADSHRGWRRCRRRHRGDTVPAGIEGTKRQPQMRKQYASEAVSISWITPLRSLRGR